MVTSFKGLSMGARKDIIEQNTTLSAQQRSALWLLSRRKQNLHTWVRVDQAVRPLPPKTLSILVGLALKLISL